MRLYAHQAIGRIGQGDTEIVVGSGSCDRIGVGKHSDNVPQSGHKGLHLFGGHLAAGDLEGQPPPGQTIAHSDHESQYTSWAFGRRLRSAGLLGSMGTIGDCFDNSVAESFFGTLQLELLDEHHWATRQQLALAIFDWIETWYKPAPPPLLLPNAQPHRLREHRRRQRGMIDPKPQPSAGPGEAQCRTGQSKGRLYV